MNNIFKTAIISALIAISVTGCSNSPSKSDAKKALENSAGIGDCEYMSVSDFEKTNGIRENDNNYKVEVKYTIKLKPTPEIKTAAEEFSNAWKNVASDLPRAKADAAEFEASPNANSPAYVEAHPDIYAKYKKDRDIIATSQLKPQFAERAIFSYRDNLLKYCPNVNHNLLSDFYSIQKHVEDFQDNVEQSYTETLEMVKTDNGWQEDR